MRKGLILKTHDGEVKWIVGRTDIIMVGDFFFLFTVENINLP